MWHGGGSLLRIGGTLLTMVMVEVEAWLELDGDSN